MTGSFNRLARLGFTFIEILVVVAILGVLATASVPYAEFSVIREKEQELETNLREIRAAIKRWRDFYENQLRRKFGDAGVLAIPEYSLYPASIASLAENGDFTVTDIDGTAPNYTFTARHPKFLELIPNDPFTGGPIWTMHYAAWPPASTVTYLAGNLATDAVGMDGAIPISSGVFDVSPVASETISLKNLRRGFDYSLNGTEYRHW
jgi:prepilin-type N-terminal cleavage/methylation domain-containing protein